MPLAWVKLQSLKWIVGEKTIRHILLSGNLLAILNVAIFVLEADNLHRLHLLVSLREAEICQQKHKHKAGHSLHRSDATLAIRLN